MLKHTVQFFLCLIFAQTFVTGSCVASCNTDSGCPDGEYCITITGPNPYTKCAPCNIPAGATWVQNGQRQDTGINSCQWKIQCGDKTDFQNGTWAPDNEHPTGYGSEVSDNNGLCTYSYPQNIICDAGYYRSNDNTCKQCPTSYPDSANGSTSQNSCYKQCDTIETIAHGKKTNTNSDNKAYYGNNCTYKIECDANYYTDDGACKQCPGDYPLSGTTNNNSINQCYKECTTDQITGGTTYYTSNTTAFYDNNCTNVDHIECNAGYYEDDNKCTMCPYGSTSGNGAKAKTQCYFQPGRQIWDSHNKYYTVPSGTPLYLVQ